MGKGAEILGKKIKIFKIEGREEYKIVGNFIHPCRNDKSTKSYDMFDFKSYLINL